MTEYTSYIFCIPFAADAFNLLLNRSVIDTYIAFLVIIYAFAYIPAQEAWSLIPQHKEQSHFGENTAVCSWMHRQGQHKERHDGCVCLGTSMSPGSFQSQWRRRGSARVWFWQMNHWYGTGTSSVFAKNYLIPKSVSAFNCLLWNHLKTIHFLIFFSNGFWVFVSINLVH